MHQGTIMSSHEDVPTTTNDLNQHTGFDSQSSSSNKQIQNSTEEKQQLIKATTHHETTGSASAESTDYSQTAPTAMYETILMPSSSTYHKPPRLPRVKEERYQTAADSEKCELNTLNNRLVNYLDEIKNLANMNTNLRQQINNIYRQSIGHIKEGEQINKTKFQHSLEIESNLLRQQINNEVQQQVSIQIRLQRADYDRIFYRNEIKLILTYDQKQKDQIRIIKQQLGDSLYELDQLKKQYDKQKQDLQLYKNQYNEYMTKIIEYTNEYDTITYERMQNEYCLSTLKEHLSFERAYNHQCHQEFEYLEKVQYDLNGQFNKTEFENIVHQIRQDYQTYNEIQISEFEISYKTKYNSIEQKFKKEINHEEIKDLIEHNQSLQQKLKQLETNLHDITEQNRQQLEISNHQYQQLHIQLPELESLIIHSRDNTIHLWSEINTYRCLLINLTQQKSKSSPLSIYKINDFIIHIENGIIWVRI